jgi:hypothetical protein
MVRRLRHLAAALAVAALTLSQAAPASAGAVEDVDSHQVPVFVDLALMRPLGLAATAAGVAVFLPAAALTAIFHRESVPIVYDTFVRGPYDFTFRHPIGRH